MQFLIESIAPRWRYCESSSTFVKNVGHLQRDFFSQIFTMSSSFIQPRDLRRPNKVWAAESYLVELSAVDGDRLRPLISEVYRVADPRTALGFAVVDCMRLHPFEQIDVDSIRIYPK